MFRYPYVCCRCRIPLGLSKEPVLVAYCPECYQLTPKQGRDKIEEKLYEVLLEASLEKLEKKKQEQLKILAQKEQEDVP